MRYFKQYQIETTEGRNKEAHYLNKIKEKKRYLTVSSERLNNNLGAISFIELKEVKLDITTQKVLKVCWLGGLADNSEKADQWKEVRSFLKREHRRPSN